MSSSSSVSSRISVSAFILSSSSVSSEISVSEETLTNSFSNGYLVSDSLAVISEAIGLSISSVCVSTSCSTDSVSVFFNSVVLSSDESIISSGWTRVFLFSVLSSKFSCFTITDVTALTCGDTICSRAAKDCANCAASSDKDSFCIRINCSNAACCAC